MITAIAGQVSSFVTIFLGIFIEAAPFLLLGAIASGLVESFVSRDDLTRLIPRNAFAATLIGGLIGFTFPVCECGVVPLTRRLLRKGLPLSTGISFLLAAPILNPVVLASTAAAYGWGKMLAARFMLGFLIAVAVGLIFSLHQSPQNILLLPTSQPTGENTAKRPIRPFRTRFQAVLRIAGDEFFEMGRFLVIGSLLAALMQTLVPQATLLAIGTGPVRSVFIMQILAFVLSVCSTVDAFLSLAFVNTFTTGSILAFLVFGPMVDIKSTLMFLRVFKKRYVLYLVVMPLLLTTLATVFMNLNLGW
ncbi:MAG: permease [Anaerolineae bacterium]|nr:permease [Anaerolineae bacterium]